MSERILVIEDDPSILRGLQLNLGMEGYAVRSAADGETGLTMARAERFDLLVVDDLGSGALLPTAPYGLAPEPTVPERVAAGADLVCFSGDKLLGGPQAGLQLGADDYMVKPFSLKELLARIGALLRRRRARGETGAPRDLRRAGHVEVDLAARRASAGGKPLELTAKEYDLLAWFVAHPDRVYSREQLMEAVWGSRYFGTARTVDNFVARLRAHIGDDADAPRHLETVRGVGYRFNP